VSTSDLNLGAGLRYIKSDRHDFYCDTDALAAATLRTFRRMGWKPPHESDYPRVNGPA
jgi:hypothetical protein